MRKILFHHYTHGLFRYIETYVIVHRAVLQREHALQLVYVLNS
jgi:hypothetical protein